MLLSPSGGDGTPSPPNVDMHSDPPPVGDHERNKSERIPLGNDRDTDLGAPVVTTIHQNELNNNHTPMKGVTLDRVDEEEIISDSDVEKSEQETTMDIDIMDNATIGTSLASHSETNPNYNNSSMRGAILDRVNEEYTVKDKETVQPEQETVMDTNITDTATIGVSLSIPTCHQTMDAGTREETQQDRNETLTDPTEVATEVATVINSINDVALKEYQMKLSICKKDDMETIVSIVRLMMQMEWGMEVHRYDTLQTDQDDGIISLFEHLPESVEDRALYFKPIYDKRNKFGTSIVFRIVTEYSHVKWRKLMEKEKLARDSKLRIGIHKLESIETQIIGFVAQKHPEETHINRYETIIMLALPRGTPKLTIERIYPKTTTGFDEPVKTDVLAIRVSKVDVKAVDMAMSHLLPPQVKGPYYVSYHDLDDEVKRKTYKHQNWYTSKVKTVKVSGFNNIDRKYDIGLNKNWSFRDFMCDQPTSLEAEKVHIDVDNGGSKVKGTKILVMPQHLKTAQRLYNEFRKLTKQTIMDDDDVDMMSDADTQVSSNIKRNEDQLKEMFDDNQFPELGEATMSMDSSTKKASKQDARNGTTMKQQKMRRSPSDRTASKTQATHTSDASSIRSYSSVITGSGEISDATSTLTQSNAAPRSSRADSSDAQISAMTKMMQEMHQMMKQTCTELTIARNEAKANARQVQRLSNSNRALSEQVSLLYDAVETLSRTTSCGDSTMSSISATLEKVKQLNESNPLPIPTEVITKTATEKPTGDSIIKVTQKAFTPAKLDEHIAQETQRNNSGDLNVGVAMELDSPMQHAILDEGFSTPSRKHRTNATAAAATAMVTGMTFETSNSFSALQSLGTTRGRASPKSKDGSPSKRSKKKPKTSAAFQMALADTLAKQDLAVADGVSQVHQGKVDTGVTLLGRMSHGAVRAVATLTGFGYDEEIQDTLVTGDDTWQDSWGEASSDSDL